jgi:hypothetical protein
MKPFISGFLIVFLWFQSALADTTPDDPKVDEALRSNVIDFRDWMIKQLSQFPKADPRNVGRGNRNYAFIPQKNRIITANQYNRAAKSDWVKAQVMQGLSNLSQQLASTAGTAFTQNGANQLQQNSVQLQQSNDPQFQQIGTLFSQQAQAMQTGNVEGANQIASQVAAVPAPIIPPGYQPTQDETNLAATLHSIIGSVIGAVLTAAIAVYGGPIASALAGPAVQSVFGGGQSVGTGLATVPNSAKALSSTGLTALQSGGAATLQQLGNVNVKPLQPQNSSNAAGPPPAQ